FELVRDLVCGRTGDAVGSHPFHQTRAQARHPAVRTLRAHRLTELIGFRGTETGDVDRHLHELLLEERYSQRLLQARFEQRVRIGDLLLTVAAPEVGVHRTALDRAGTDERDLDD